jgi:hypothetical protein
MKIKTIKDLREAIAHLDDNDAVVVEIHEGIRSEDLYDFNIDVIDGIILTDGSTISEVRLCI